MKGKRIDIFLSVASFFHLPIIGFGGAVAAELISEKPRPFVVSVGSTMAILIALVVLYIYVKAYRKTNKKYS